MQGERRELLERAPTVLNAAELVSLQQRARNVHVADALLDYIQALVARSRAQMSLGLSPRAAQGLLRAAQAWALIGGEQAVLPEHVQAVFPAIAAHRLEPREGNNSVDGNQIADGLVKSVAVPI